MGRVDVVKVSHHGSAERTAYLGLGAVIGLVGVGADNDYGHPTSPSRLLAAAGTGHCEPTGRLILVSPGDGGTARIWTAR